MQKAYIKTDALEDPQVLNELIKKLQNQGITTFTTDKHWKDIWDNQPFLYFRTPYLRIEKENEILNFHYSSPNIPYIKTANNEIVSINPSAPEYYDFVLNIESYFKEPDIEPLPILLGTYNRPEYLHLTLNTLLYSLKSSRQKIYIVASQPSIKTKEILHTWLEKDNRINVVIAQNNLKYAFANFGSKFYNLKKFIHYEEDGLLPEHLHYHIPYWTSQLNHRFDTAGAVAFRTYEGNWSSAFYKCQLMAMKNILKVPDNVLWFYTRQHNDYMVPIGGNGIIIDSTKVYKNFKPPGYHSSDSHILKDANSLCIVNLPVYHIGANQEMDYPDYVKNKDSDVARYQNGINWRNGEAKTIDLETDWSG